MLIYISIVYLWALGVQPMGRDYEAMANGGEGLPFIAKSLFRIELGTFGDWAPGYQLVNFALMYLCMLLLYRLVTSVVKGPAWLGVFAANLFMANPLHTESMLNLTGVGDLVPCFFGLAALVAYAHHVEGPSRGRYTVAMALGLFSALAFPMYALLPAVFLLYEGLVTGSHRRSRWRLAGSTIALVISIGYHLGAINWAGIPVSERFTPLYFTLYCIGFLPETVFQFEQRAWVGWLAAASVAAAVLAVHLRARRPVFMFAILAMLLLRLGPLDRPVNWVHLVGGGQLLLHQALLMTAVAALYLRIMEHPKWRPSMIYSSFSVSVLFFILQAVSIWHWKDAGNMVRDFQARAAAFAETTAEPFAVTPAYTYYKGAPLQLSDAIAFDTPFSAAITHRPIWPVQYEKQDVWQLALSDWSPQQAVFESQGLTAMQIRARTYGDSELQLEEHEDYTADTPRLIVSITPTQTPFPKSVLLSFVDGE